MADTRRFGPKDYSETEGTCVDVTIDDIFDASVKSSVVKQLSGNIPPSLFFYLILKSVANKVSSAASKSIDELFDSDLSYYLIENHRAALKFLTAMLNDLRFVVHLDGGFLFQTELQVTLAWMSHVTKDMMCSPFVVVLYTTDFGFMSNIIRDLPVSEFWQIVAHDSLDASTECIDLQSFSSFLSGRFLTSHLPAMLPFDAFADLYESLNHMDNESGTYISIMTRAIVEHLPSPVDLHLYTIDTIMKTRSIVDGAVNHQISDIHDEILKSDRYHQVSKPLAKQVFQRIHQRLVFYVIFRLIYFVRSKEMVKSKTQLPTMIANYLGNGLDHDQCPFHKDIYAQELIRTMEQVGILWRMSTGTIHWNVNNRQIFDDAVIALRGVANRFYPAALTRPRRQLKKGVSKLASSSQLTSASAQQSDQSFLDRAIYPEEIMSFNLGHSDFVHTCLIAIPVLEKLIGKSTIVEDEHPPPLPLLVCCNQVDSFDSKVRCTIAWLVEAIRLQGPPYKWSTRISAKSFCPTTLAGGASYVGRGQLSQSRHYHSRNLFEIHCQCANFFDRDPLDKSSALILQSAILMWYSMGGMAVVERGANTTRNDPAAAWVQMWRNRVLKIAMPFDDGGQCLCITKER
eukprot:GHVH01003258.1.p1 GENE.GHVH01003258.1~~GHVH01003258.1.p1  ORF type:complete len:628 (+),score=90.58 GHVH01003258.1:3467-5350(+)